MLQGWRPQALTEVCTGPARLQGGAPPAPPSSWGPQQCPRAVAECLQPLPLGSHGPSSACVSPPCVSSRDTCPCSKAYRTFPHSQVWGHIFLKPHSAHSHHPGLAFEGILRPHPRTSHAAARPWALTNGSDHQSRGPSFQRPGNRFRANHLPKVTSAAQTRVSPAGPSPWASGAQVVFPAHPYPALHPTATGSPRL